MFFIDSIFYATFLPLEPGGHGERVYMPSLSTRRRPFLYFFLLQSGGGKGF